jgi:hypothetical protein
MTKGHARVRDADLDERPFGDSHFGESQRDRRGLEKRHASRHALPSGARRPGEVKTSCPYAWHEGCFEDLEPNAPGPARRRRDRPSG